MSLSKRFQKYSSADLKLKRLWFWSIVLQTVWNNEGKWSMNGEKYFLYIIKILWKINDRMRILKINGPIYLDTHIYVNHRIQQPISKLQILNFSKLLQQNWFRNLGSRKFIRTLAFVPKTQTSNEIIQLNIETTNPVFTNFKVQYR